MLFLNYYKIFMHDRIIIYSLSCQFSTFDFILFFKKKTQKFMKIMKKSFVSENFNKIGQEITSV